jgi:hypothetical protein
VQLLYRAGIARTTSIFPDAPLLIVLAAGPRWERQAVPFPFQRTPRCARETKKVWLCALKAGQ